MTFLERCQLLDRLDGLIRHRATGTPRELAGRLNLSLRGMHNQLRILKDFGAEVEFCYHSRSYVYRNSPDLRFSPRITDHEGKKIFGGKRNYLYPLLKMHETCTVEY